MPQCVLCREFLPPQLCIDVSKTEKKCIFCNAGKNVIYYGERGEKKAVKDEILKEYKMYLIDVKERNELLKKAVRGDATDIPTKILE